jgi:hypothetical protein
MPVLAKPIASATSMTKSMSMLMSLLISLSMSVSIATLILALSATANAASAAPKATTRVVYKCILEDAPVRYQDTPCTQNDRTEQLHVAAIDPVLPPKRLQPRTRTQRKTLAAPTQRSRPQIRPVRASQPPQLEPCPATYEDAGQYVIQRGYWRAPDGTVGKSKTPLSSVWAHYKSLPRRTYLKNQGKWPAHCPQ